GGGAQVELTADVVEPTDNVTLHAHDLAVDSSSVRVVAGDEALPVTRVSNDTARQFLVLSLGATAAAGRRLTVSMRYVGRLNDVLQGFYRSSYTIGNETRDGLPDYEWDHYGESVPMSTYLVAWAVTDFAARRDGSFAVWARASALQQAAYSLHVGPRILRFYEQYFNISYPLPKVDMIALPDFAAGAMENWGLITYRETAMLYEQGVSTNSNKQSVATVVAHELAHQWFGNLVTPSWWTDLWLNEGFASYVEYLGVNAVEPTWKILEQFVSYDLQNVFALDALESSHPISIAVGHPDEINEIFDRISYGKGASIIRMMDHFLTTDVFKKGLHNYLKKWSYDSSTQNDLWQALTEQAHADGVLAADVTVKRIMDTWTLQTGFPVVTVTRDYDAGGATVT
ncbi:Aminopeptidase, partial [Gryllus bimaculatus]